MQLVATGRQELNSSDYCISHVIPYPTHCSSVLLGACPKGGSPHRSAQLRAATPPTIPIQLNIMHWFVIFWVMTRLPTFRNNFYPTYLKYNSTLNMKMVVLFKVEFCPENGGDIFIVNIINHLQDLRGSWPVIWGRLRGVGECICRCFIRNK